MTSTDDTALATLAADFPGWHLWRSRDSRGRNDDTLGRLTARSSAGLRALLEQQRVVEAATESAA